MDFNRTLEVLQEATGYYYISGLTEKGLTKFYTSDGKWASATNSIKKFANRKAARDFMKGNKIGAKGMTLEIDFKRGAPVNEGVKDDLDELIVNGSLDKTKLMKLKSAGLVDENGKPTKKAKEEYSELFD